MKTSAFAEVKRYAYMLMYRRKDHKAESGSQEAVPENLLEEIRLENDIYKRQKEEYDKRRMLTKLEVHYNDVVYSVMVSKDNTVVEATKAVFDETKLADAGFTVEQVRIRVLDALKNLPGPPLDPLRTLKSLDFGDTKVMVLETRELSEEFPEYHAAHIGINIQEYDASLSDYKAPVLLSVPEAGAVADMRAAAAKAMGTQPARVRLVLLTTDTGVEFKNDKESLKELHIQKGDTIRTERCEDFTVGTSLVLEKFEQQINAVTIKIIFEKNSEPLSVEADARKPLSVLKEKVAEKLLLNAGDFKLRNHESGLELKETSKHLSFYGIQNNSTVVAERGVPLQPHQYIVKVFIPKEVQQAESTEQKAPPQASDLFIFASDAVMEEDWDLARITKELSSLTNMPPPELMRIREKADMKVRSLFVHGKTLKQNLPGLRDYKEIVVQRTLEPEVLTDQHVLVNLQRWHPKDFKADPTVEKAFLGATTMAELRILLGEAFSIPSEHVRACKPHMWKLKDKDNYPTLDWDDPRLLLTDTLAGPPWRTKHGDTLVFKDNREAERSIAKEKALNMPSGPVYRHVEAGIKIYTPQEQARRAEDLKKKQEEMAKQAQQNLAEGGPGAPPPPPLPPMGAPPPPPPPLPEDLYDGIMDYN